MYTTRTSKIWTMPKEELVKLVLVAQSFSDVLRMLGFSTNGASNHRRLRTRLESEGIEYSALIEKGKAVGRTYVKNIPLEAVLTENSTFARQHLKKRLVKEGLLEYKCAECGLTDWMGKPVSLQLDHINGNPQDNRLHNIRLICPNCHSQTENYAGKKNRRK